MQQQQQQKQQQQQQPQPAPPPVVPGALRLQVSLPPVHAAAGVFLEGPVRRARAGGPEPCSLFSNRRAGPPAGARSESAGPDPSRRPASPRSPAGRFGLRCRRGCGAELESAGERESRRGREGGSAVPAGRPAGQPSPAGGRAPAAALLRRVSGVPFYSSRPDALAAPQACQWPTVGGARRPGPPGPGVHGGLAPSLRVRPGSESRAIFLPLH
jgi:hypothetical protein